MSRVHKRHNAPKCGTCAEDVYAIQPEPEPVTHSFFEPPLCAENQDSCDYWDATMQYDERCCRPRSAHPEPEPAPEERLYVAAEELAKSLAMHAISSSQPMDIALRPYAVALLQAHDALAGVLESPAELDDERMSYVPRQVSRPDWDDCKAALACLDAVLAGVR